MYKTGVTRYGAGVSVSVLLFVLLLSIAPVSGDSGEPLFTDSWFLVRLDIPLESQLWNEEFPLVTGRPALDAAIREAGVQGIGYALAVTMRDPKDPEALARYGLDRTYRFRAPEGSDILALVERFSTVPGVDLAEPDYFVQSAVVPDDTRFDEQWGLHNTGQTGGCVDSDVDAPESWDVSTGGGVIVAIADTGCDSDHPDLLGKLEPGYDFINDDNDPEDDHGHGTGIGSVVGASTNNAEGIAGVCWNCRLMPVKVADDLGTTVGSSVADGIVWATDHGARIINISLTGGSGSVDLNAVGYAYDAGVVMAAANGNDGIEDIGAPAQYSETLAVGLTRSCDERGPLSNYGPENDFVAPGYEILTATMGGGYGTASGTSQATPHVSGLVGLMMTLNPSLGQEEARHLIRSGAEDEVGRAGEDTPGFDYYMGWGRINGRQTLDGTTASMSLRVDGKAATRPYLETANPLADSYDFVRGSLSALSESAGGVELGTLNCLENDSADPDTAGNEDTETPPVGEAFFYLARFNAAPGPGSWGGSSRNRDRVPFVMNSTGADWFVESDQEAADMGSAAYRAGDVNGDGYGDVIVAGRSYDNDQADEGRAFAYHGSASGLETTAAWTAESNQSDSLYGWSASTGGDVNGDGFDDVIVGAQKYDGDLTDEGAVFVYMGSPSGLEAAPAWTAEGNQFDARFGFRVRTAGDVNGDGYDDVIVGAILHDASGGSPGDRPDRGRAFVWYGSASGLTDSPADWWYEPDQAYARAGVGLGTAGDVNGDGYDDVVVGAPLYDNGETDEGRLFVFYGSASGLPGAPDEELEINVADARLGYAVETAGDVNGDGYDDIVAGAWTYTNGESQEGAVYVFLGSASGVETAPAWSFESDQAGANLGAAVASAGDTDGDGYDDIVVGAWLYDGAHRTDTGQTWLFRGSSTGPEASPTWIGFVRQSGAEYGFRMSSAGDVNGDSLSDVIVGSTGYYNGEFSEGRAWAYYGPLTGTPENPPNGCPE